MEGKPNYNDDELLLLSGIQHLAFCPRQWALIHIEQQWAENVKTIEGQHLHERVDDPLVKDSSNTLVVWRSVNLLTYRLGLTGRADVKQRLTKVPCFTAKSGDGPLYHLQKS